MNFNKSVVTVKSVPTRNGLNVKQLRKVPWFKQCNSKSSKPVFNLSKLDSDEIFKNKCGKILELYSIGFCINASYYRVITNKSRISFFKRRGGVYYYVGKLMEKEDNPGVFYIDMYTVLTIETILNMTVLFDDVYKDFKKYDMDYLGELIASYIY